MKSLNLTLTAVLLLLTAHTATVFGQCDCPTERDQGWCWGEDPGLAKEKQAVIQDNVNNENYAAAMPAFEWVAQNLPGMHKSIYQLGEKMFVGLYQQEQDKDQKKAHIKRLMEVFDKRIDCFGERAYVLNRKGLYALAQGGATVAFYDSLYHLYKEIIALNQTQTFTANLDYFSQIMGVRRKYMKDEYVAENVLEDYDMLSALIEKKMAESQDDAKEMEKLKELQDFADNALCQLISCDCDFAKEKLYPKLIEDRSQLTLAVKIERFMRDDCKTDPKYLEVLLILWESEAYQTWKTAKSMSLLYKVRGGNLLEENKEDEAMAALEEANKWLIKAIELAEGSEDVESADLASLYMERGKIFYKEGKYTDARKYFLKAANGDSELASEAYSKIGDMYMSSGSICKGDPVTGSACYFAAYDMYQRAGNSSGMSNAQQYFPPMDKIFMLNYKVGQSIEVGCWIGGTTTIRKK